MAKKLSLRKAKRKPGSAVTLNRSNRLASRAIVYPFFAGIKSPLGEPDLVYNTAGTPSFGAIGPRGVSGVRFNTTSDWVQLPNDARLNTTVFTQLIVFRIETLTAVSSTLTESHRTNSSTGACQFAITTATSRLQLVKDNTVVVAESSSSGPVYQAGTVAVAAVSYDNAGNVFFALNGHDITGTGGTQTFTRAGFQLMTKRQDAEETPRPADTYMFAYWPYAMARGDLAELTRNPWQLLGTNDRIFAVPPVVFDGAVTANQVVSSNGTTGESVVSANQVTSAAAVATVSTDAAVTTNQATSAAAVATVSIDAAVTANQATSAAAVATVSTDAAVTSNQVTSTSGELAAGAEVSTNQVTSAAAVATVSIDAAVTANQAISAAAVATVSTDATATANQVTSAAAVATVSTDAAVTSSQVTSTNATATISIDAAVTTNQVTSSDATAGVSMDSTCAANQVISVGAAAALVLDGVASSSQVMSGAGTAVVSTPLAVVMNQVMSVNSAIAKEGSVIQSPAKWRVTVIQDREQILVTRLSDNI